MRLLLSAAFLLTSLTSGWAADQTKPNVIIVMTDDQGLGDFSFTGNPLLKTPNFDAFAGEAVRFTDFHVCPMCSPTRGQLLTGLTESGEYEFTLRRWPKRTNAAFGDKYEPSAKSPANKANLTTVGFPTIAAAAIDIAGVKASSTADPKATGATLTATLPAGRTKLKTWFADAEGKDLCGAFFVTVARKKS